MGGVVSRLAGQLTGALFKALQDAPYWDIAESVAMALCAELSFRNHGTSMVADRYLDHLRIVLLQVRITMRDREDVTPAGVERCFWEMCPVWLAAQFGVPDGMHEAAASARGDWGA